MNSLKKSILIAAIIPLSAFLSQGQIAQWTFENTFASIAGTSTTIGGIAAETGSGFASGVHAAAAAWSSPAGNGSAHSFSVNTTAPGDYFQFQLNTVGSSGISVSFDMARSSTGPTNFSLSYSLEGTLFTSLVSSFVVLSNSTSTDNTGTGLTTAPWSSGGARQSPFTYNYDLSSVTALNNATNVIFRLTDVDAAPGPGGGTVRVDNFTVAVVPEPSSIALLLAGGIPIALGLLCRRYRC